MPRQLRRGFHVFEAQCSANLRIPRELWGAFLVRRLLQGSGMRSFFLLSILLVAAAACDKSLTPDMTGTGGSRTGAGGEGGTGPGAGGSGGDVASICDALVAEYRSAITEAETCQVGASGQCQQLAAASLNGCSCATYVTDSSALSTIENYWQGGARAAAPAP